MPLRWITRSVTVLSLYTLSIVLSRDLWADCRSTRKSLDVRVNMFDMSGDPEFADVREEFYPDSQCVFALFDLTNSKTFKHLAQWIEELKASVSPVILICFLHCIRILIDSSRDFAYCMILLPVRLLSFLD
jgi:GTPase SAR1 family protein